MATPLHLLILEDNPSDAELMLHSLRNAGYDPIFNRVETEQEYRDHLHPDLEIVLADFSMPEFDALRALEVMQERQLDIPVIIVSGSIGEEHAVRIMQRGATDYVIKDRMERLGHAVTQALERKRLRDANQRAERVAEASRQAHEKTVAINEALMLGSVRQHELTEIAEAANDRLQAEIAERRRLEDELRNIAAELSEADHRKDEFLALLAHELRGPLAPISNAVQILLLAPTAGASPEVKQAAIEMMERQVVHMARLVDDLLDVSRIGLGKLELRKERVELAAVVNHAVAAARPTIASKGLELEVHMPPQSVSLDGDPVRLTQVLGNLLNNACKFTDRGGRIRLVVETPEQGGGPAVIRVQDNGMGIAADQLSRIFGLFTQNDTSLERSQDGLGIGLSLVKALTQMHGGSVEAISAGVGHGSEFIVRLPILPEPAPAQASPATPPEPARRAAVPARRILVVDDNLASAESLSLLLRLNGHDVHTAHDGIAALEAAEATRPEVILLDIGLPKLNGYEVAHRIREQPWGQDISLIALTGWGQEDDKRRAREAGFDHHMVKPVRHTELTALLARLPRGAVAG